ncbi:MAG: Uma2 family endonuclease [Gammaproteobacteria bacterium]|nr:Uma2 family endonuclease [Gammaproteobacteria bacterium]
MSSIVSMPPRKHRLSVADYHCMGEIGILDPNVHCELIEGEIIDTSPIGSVHAGTVTMLGRLFNRVVGDMVVIALQSPVVLNEHSEPEPDIVLLKSRADFYKSADPHAEDVLLIVEVADTSLRYDRDTKIPLYARNGISEVWLVDLQSLRVEVFQEPAAEGYAKIRVHDPAKPLTPAALPETAIDVSDLFA